MLPSLAPAALFAYDPCRSRNTAFGPAPWTQLLLTPSRNGKPVAVLVPMEDAETLDAWEDAEDARLAALAHDEWVAAGRPACITLEELAAQHEIDLAADAE